MFVATYTTDDERVPAGQRAIAHIFAPGRNGKNQAIMERQPVFHAAADPETAAANARAWWEKEISRQPKGRPKRTAVLAPAGAVVEDADDGEAI